MSKLKPCPFCGDPSAIRSAKTTGVLRAVSAIIDCYKCGASISCLDHSEGVVEGKWNTRADGWISVDDEWPERFYGQKIWCFYDGIQFESECDKDLIWCNVYGNPFTHWMPLPATPTEAMS